jgi:hypothetical protein
MTEDELCECGAVQETEFRGDVEYYVHEGHCPCCGEYVACVRHCLEQGCKGEP